MKKTIWYSPRTHTMGVLDGEAFWVTEFIETKTSVYCLKRTGWRLVCEL